jgi:ATP adenylyltransferase
MNVCTLCGTGSRESWNTPLIESANFKILPSLGALVEGWVLLVPKRHFLSMGSLPESLITEMQQLKEKVCSSLSKTYGKVSAFEHGPGRIQSVVGCGVDHAHLHLVPIDFNLSVAVAPYLPNGSRWSAASYAGCRAAARDGVNYLYLEQPIGRGRIVRDSRLGSQLFRRAVAAHLGVPDEFDWRSNPQLENVTRTIVDFTAHVRVDSATNDASEHAA